MRLVSLLFVCHEDQVLLGKKKVRFGAGYWNGFGGGVEVGETIEESACREALEEACISVQPEHLEKIAHITFSFEERPEFNHDVHVFKTNIFDGKPQESDEMIPQWHSLEQLPMDKMWPSDPYWVPLVLQQEKTIEAACIFSGTEKPFPVKTFEYTEATF